MTDDERTLIEDAQDQLVNYHIGRRQQRASLTQEEARALEVARCAYAAVIDTATLCARAGLIGTAITIDLDNAASAMQRLINCIEGKT